MSAALLCAHFTGKGLALRTRARAAARPPTLPDPGVVVLPVVAVHGAQVPWGKVAIQGVPVVAARRLCCC